MNAIDKSSESLAIVSVSFVWTITVSLSSSPYSSRYYPTFSPSVPGFTSVPFVRSSFFFLLSSLNTFS